MTGKSAYKRHVEVVLVVQGDTESGPACGTRQDSVVAVTGREHQLREATGAPRGRPVPPGVEISVEEEQVELGLVLNRALHPSELFLQLFRRLRD